MRKSPPIDIKGKDPEINARPQLVYVAEIFKTTMIANKFATLEINGSSSFYVDQITQALERLAIPRNKIVPLLFTAPGTIPFGSNSLVPIPSGEPTASIYIDYGAGKQRVTVQFQPESKPLPIDVEFEVAPDGTMLTEVKAEWSTPLKFAVADSARMGVRQVKFATKIVGLAGFDRKAVNNIETELKGKLKQTFQMYLKTTGNEFLKIQFYGAIGLKYADDKLKPIGEAGVLFEVPFDLADILR